MVHGYCTNTYDIHTGQFLHIPQGDKMYQGLLANAIKDYQSKAPRAPNNPSPWAFDTKTGKWIRRNTDGAGPPIIPSIVDLLCYLPTKKATYYMMFASGRCWSALYDAATNKWTMVSEGNTAEYFNKPTSGSDNVTYYDTKRNRIDYMTGGGVHWIFDSETLKWRDAQSGGPGAIGYICTWTYDAANDVGILVNYRHPEKSANGIWIYDPNKNSWTRSAKPIPAFTENSNGFYDPELNVHFTYNARDNCEGTMWAYRYKKAKKSGK
jgi:hypothetical protein